MANYLSYPGLVSQDPGPSSVELPWTGHSGPRTLNVTHAEPKYRLVMTRKTGHISD